MLQRNAEEWNMGSEDATVLSNAAAEPAYGGVSRFARFWGRHPPQIQYLLHLLNDCRPLSTTQYDRLMYYLQKRREFRNQREMVNQVRQEPHYEGPQPNSN